MAHIAAGFDNWTASGFGWESGVLRWLPVLVLLILCAMSVIAGIADPEAVAAEFG